MAVYADEPGASAALDGKCAPGANPLSIFGTGRVKPRDGDAGSNRTPVLAPGGLGILGD